MARRFQKVDVTEPSVEDTYGILKGLKGRFEQHHHIEYSDEALRAAAELNIRVPHELSVIGFDDIELSRFVFPALTTVGQSIRLLGEIAAQLLLQRIAEREEPMQRRVVAPALVLRESTAPPLVRV